LENQKLQKLCKEGQLDAVYEKLKLMLEKGVHLSTHARDTFIKSVATGKLEIAHIFIIYYHSACNIKTFSPMNLVASVGQYIIYVWAGV
jgi:pentatricopeptide repeat protein